METSDPKVIKRNLSKLEQITSNNKLFMVTKDYLNVSWLIVAYKRFMESSKTTKSINDLLKLQEDKIVEYAVRQFYKKHFPQN